MRNLGRSFGVILVTLLLVGCLPPELTSLCPEMVMEDLKLESMLIRPETKMQSFVGCTEAQVLEKWGRPDEAYIRDDGSKRFVWKRVWSSRADVSPGYQTFILGADGIVQSWSFENIPVWRCPKMDTPRNTTEFGDDVDVVSGSGPQP